MIYYSSSRAAGKKLAVVTHDSRLAARGDRTLHIVAVCWNSCSSGACAPRTTPRPERGGYKRYQHLPLELRGEPLDVFACL